MHERATWISAPDFLFCFGRDGSACWKGTSRLLLVQQSSSVRVGGRAGALGRAHFHFCDGGINAEKHAEVLEQQMLPSKPHVLQQHSCIRSSRQLKTTICKHPRGLAGDPTGPDRSPNTEYDSERENVTAHDAVTVLHPRMHLQDEWAK